VGLSSVYNPTAFNLLTLHVGWVERSETQH